MTRTPPARTDRSPTTGPRHQPTPRTGRGRRAATAAVLTALLLPVTATWASPTTTPTPTTVPVTGVAPAASPGAAVPSGCQVVAAGREGRAWLPWARLVVPGGRLVSVDVVSGAARAELHAGTVLLQRTARRSPAATGPVEVFVLVAGALGSSWRSCTVDLARPDVDGTHHVRRLSA